MSYRSDVAEFHRAMGVPIHDRPRLRRSELRANLIEEEARETIEAIRGGDLVGAVDGLLDLIYVIEGTFLEFGVDPAGAWNEVHRSNMAKVGGTVREDGKILKPAGWIAPDIAGCLERQS